MLRVFIGWDPGEDVAFEVASYSLRRRSSTPLHILPLRLDTLRKADVYWRADDPLASTEFTYSRFLVPYLANYIGPALYCDCDFLWLADVAELLALYDPTKAVQCVQHNHRPAETWKMDGKVQDAYPRKNWSSLMLFNCAHPDAGRLTAAYVNSASGADLHRMRWTDDSSIGALPPTWNWLEGAEPLPPQPPKAVHFTRGGPWFEAWRHVAFAEAWEAERRAMNAEDRQPSEVGRIDIVD